jgi:hypothetical protein
VANASSPLEARFQPASPELGLIVVDASGVKAQISSYGSFMADGRNGYEVSGPGQKGVFV